MQQHVATSIEQAESAAGADLPQVVNDEFGAFLALLAECCESDTPRSVVVELAMAEELLRLPVPHRTHPYRCGTPQPDNTQVLAMAIVSIAHDVAFSTCSPELLRQPAPPFDGL